MVWQIEASSSSTLVMAKCCLGNLLQLSCQDSRASDKVPRPHFPFLSISRPFSGSGFSRNPSDPQFRGRWSTVGTSIEVFLPQEQTRRP